MPTTRILVQPQRKTAEKYAVPALEKGFDVIELLAQSPSPLTLSQISVRLGRSVNELFRIVRGLEARGYVTVADRSQAYQLTSKLFSLSVNSPSSQNLISTAMPTMKVLSENTFQACHLVVASDDQMVVIASMEAPGNLSFSVRIGFRQKLVDSASGVILYAFEKTKMKTLMRERLAGETDSDTWNAFETKAGHAFDQGFFEERSTFTEGITDISCPVFSSTNRVSALTMPTIKTRLSTSTEDCLRLLRNAASKISTELGAYPPTK
jgi:DNA-binding IclR family transcriptional regulator